MERFYLDTSVFGGYFDKEFEHWTMKAKPQKTMIDELREIRDKISDDLKDLSYDELVKYLEKRKTLHPKMKKQKTVNV
jgi:RNA binding exosome subunit